MNEQQKTPNSSSFILSDRPAGQPERSTGRTSMLTPEQADAEVKQTQKAPAPRKEPVERPRPIPPKPEITLGGVAVEQEQPEQTSREDPEKQLHRRQKPDMATKKQRLWMLTVSLILAFSIGLLAGVSLSFGLWHGERTEPTQPVEQTDPDQMANHIPPADSETEAPTEVVTEAPTEAVTEAPTEEATEAPTEEATEAPTEAPEPTYLIAASNSRYLTPKDYNDLSDWELVLARNEIFARHGRKFSNPEIQAYFNGCDWYKGTIDPEDFDTSVFNKYEKKNVQILKDASDAR